MGPRFGLVKDVSWLLPLDRLYIACYGEDGVLLPAKRAMRANHLYPRQERGSLFFFYCSQPFIVESGSVILNTLFSGSYRLPFASFLFS